MSKLMVHFIGEDSDIFIKKSLLWVPDIGDEIRLGGEGNEKFYKVTRRVWAYDEWQPGDSVRINIGIAEIAKDD